MPKNLLYFIPLWRPVHRGNFCRSEVGHFGAIFENLINYTFLFSKSQEKKYENIFPKPLDKWHTLCYNTNTNKKGNDNNEDYQ